MPYRRRGGGEQRAGVGMDVAVVQTRDGQQIHQPAAIHDRDAVRDFCDQIEIVRDEQIGGIVSGAERQQKLDHRCLH